jgi:hypothetical protein
MATNGLRQLIGTRCCLGARRLRPLQEQIEQANASGRTPVVFIHGLWLLASSWDRWAEHFAQAGYAPVSPGWPDDPDTVEEAIADPEAFADKTIGQVADGGLLTGRGSP